MGCGSRVRHKKGRARITSGPGDGEIIVLRNSLSYAILKRPVDASPDVRDHTNS